MAGLFSRFSAGREAQPPVASAASAKGSDAIAASPVTGGRSLPPGLTNLLGNLDQLLFVLDEKGLFAGASPPLLRLLGMTQERLVGRAATDVFDAAKSLVTECKSGLVQFRDASGGVSSGTLSVTAVPGAAGAGFRVALLTQTKHGNGQSLGTGPRSSSLPRGNAAAFNGTIKDRLKAGSPPHQLTAGRIELISLDEVKEALGDRWSAHAQQARSVARSVLTKRLAAVDVFTEVEDGSFLVCYSSIDLTEARVKSKLIAREIRDRLLGESNDAFTVASQVATVEVEEQDVEGAEFDVMSLLTRQLDSVRAEQQQATHRQFGTLMAKATLGLRPVLNRKLAPSGLVLAHLMGGCTDWLDNMSPGEQREKATFELDALLLGLAFKHIYTALEGGRGPGIIVPVHYVTLCEKRFADNYLALCRRVDEAARARILFELDGLPPNLPDLRLQEILSRLAPFCAHQIVRVPNIGHRFTDLNRFRLTLISITARGFGSADETLGRRFKAFSKMVHNGGEFPSMCNNSGCRVLVHGVADNASACWYAARGADFSTMSKPATASPDDNDWIVP